MRFIRRPARAVLAASVVTVSLLACGGGGGGTEAPRFSDATLSGTYRFTYLTSESQVRSEQGFAAFDGQGGWSALSSGTYHVGADGTLELTDGKGWIEGAVSADGIMAFGASVSWGSSPTMTVLLRKGDGFGNASLSGTYFVAGFGTDGQAESICLTGTMTFDGSGTIAASVSVNKGKDEPSPESATGSYSVSSDGSLQISLPELEIAGTLRAKGDFAIFSFAEENEIGWIVAVKRSESLTESDVLGSYRVVSFGDDSQARGISSVGTLDILPAGQAMHQAKYNRAGIIIPASASGNYTLQPDGTIVIALSDGLLLRGAMVADRSVAVAANMNPQAPPTVIIALRQ